MQVLLRCHLCTHPKLASSVCLRLQLLHLLLHARKGRH